MNRRSGDRRRGERSSFTKAHMIMTSLTLVVSLISLLVSLSTRTAITVAASVSEPVVEEKPVEVQPVVEEKSSVQVQKARPKVESKRNHAKERVGRVPKRVKIVFEESVARAPASVPTVEQGTKTIKYSNDLYEKEDLL